MPKVTLKKLLVAYGPRRDLGKASEAARWTTGGTAETTASGTRYAIAYREPGAEGEVGTLTLDVGADGLLATAALRVAGDVETPEFAITHRLAYGLQQVRVPRQRLIASPVLVNGCRAAFTRLYPHRLAREIAAIVNFLDDGESGRTIVKDIRRAGRVLNEAKAYGIDVKVRPTKYGVLITGRHKLLKHPYVSTVFLRNGKAVAHRVR